MNMKTTIGNKGGLVDRYINTSYDIVKLVANNIDLVTLVGAYIDGGEIDDAIAAAVTTQTDVVITNADVVITNADVVSTNADATATAADLVSVQSLYDQFDDRYLGSKVAAPTLDNDGNALLTGALYWNSVSSSIYIYTGAAWVQAYNASTGISDSATFSKLFITDLGIGIDANPDALWDAGYSVLQLNSKTALWESGGNASLFGHNIYHDGTTYKYLATGSNGASLYQQDGGVHSFFVFADGVNDAVATTILALQINQNGEVIITGKGTNTTTNIGIGAGVYLATTTGLENVALGSSALGALLAGASNIAIGNSTLAALTTGNFNVAIGDSAGIRCDSGLLNAVLLGYQAGDRADGLYATYVGYQSGGNAAHTDANYNTGLGAFSLSLITTGDNNTSLGYHAGGVVTTGSDNTYVGYNAGDATNIESRNTAVGSSALSSNNNGNDQTAVGYNALFTVSGDFNTAIGSEAGTNAGAGIVNGVFVGYQAGYTGSGNNNVYLGYQAGYGVALGAGNSNIGIGSYALNGVDDSRYHVAIGFESMLVEDGGGWGTVAIGYQTLKASNVIGAYSENVAIGHQAMLVATSGYANTAIGSDTLKSILTSYQNTAIGNEAMSLVTETGTALGNVAIGHQALLRGSNIKYCVAVGFGALAGDGVTIPTGDRNIAIGYQAMLNITTGNNNTAVGDGTSQVLTTGSNNTVLGNQAEVTTAAVSNQVVLGNSSVTAFRCQVALTVVSDERDKENIVPVNYGLDFVSKLHPVLYTNAPRKGDRLDSKLRIGFLAQDIKETMDEIGIDFPGWSSYGEDDPEEFQELTYQDFIPVMVNAIKELKAEVDTLKDYINGS